MRRVKVYRNIRAGNYSVMRHGRVIAHVPSIELEQAVFTVRESGRLRVLAERRKNVHAFVTGLWNGEPGPLEPLQESVTYNPYTMTSFQYRASGDPVTHAAHARLTPQGVTITR